MNWIVGLKRTAAVICGGFALMLAIIAVAENMNDHPGSAFGFALMALVGGYVVYRLACWLIDGFAGKDIA